MPWKPRGERARQVFVGTSPREEAKELGGRGPERAVSLSHLKGSEAVSALPLASFRRSGLKLWLGPIGSDRKRTRRKRRRWGRIRCKEGEVAEAIWRGGATPPPEEERRSASSRVEKRGRGDVGRGREAPKRFADGFHRKEEDPGRFFLFIF